jgi:histidine phosphotransfer protein HptB
MTGKPLSEIDAAAIAGLRELGGDEFLREILGIYLEDTPKRLADLVAAAAAADVPSYVRAAHTIKGSSSNVGAAAVRQVAEELERRAKSEPIAALDGLRAELAETFARTAVGLRAIIA